MCRSVPFVPAKFTVYSDRLLGNLYRATQRTNEAEQSFQEALTIIRQLAEVNPDVYLSNVAATLHNLANLYSVTYRMKEAEPCYQEALATCRRGAEDNPRAYMPYVALTLSNLGNLYRDTQRMNEAEQSYQEALTIRRQLAEVNPQVHFPDLAVALNTLGRFYRRGADDRRGGVLPGGTHDSSTIGSSEPTGALASSRRDVERPWAFLLCYPADEGGRAMFPRGPINSRTVLAREQRNARE
jgi:tetratricopeptide (TPR) repeat protein